MRPKSLKQVQYEDAQRIKARVADIEAIITAWVTPTVIDYSTGWIETVRDFAERYAARLESAAVPTQRKGWHEP